MGIGECLLQAFYLFPISRDILKMNAFRTNYVIDFRLDDTVERAIFDKDISCLDFTFGTVDMQEVIAFLAGDVF